MHIHRGAHCDIRLSKLDQEQVLAQGKAREHRWAPEAGYVTFVAQGESDLEQAMELIRLSYAQVALAFMSSSKNRVSR